MKNEPEKWKADYDRDGYLVVEDCVDPATLQKLRTATEKITSNIDALPPGLRRHVHLETDFLKYQPERQDLTADQLGQAVKLIMELPAFDPVFAELICYAPLLDILQAVFGTTEFAFHNYKAIIKAPRVSSAFAWHRDLPYLEHTTPDLVTAMLCLDEMTEANGATLVYPGSHRVPHASVTKADRDIPEANLPKDVKPVMLTCPAGSAVVFHVNNIHGGGPNRSPIPRRNLISIWSGPGCYPVEANRYLYQDLMPRSRDPQRQRQTQMAFPSLKSSLTQN
jgi:ectoine hydroxylase-related dioxygenase (phytanoyl-CoA dioxygenase family)